MSTSGFVERRTHIYSAEELALLLLEQARPQLEAAVVELVRLVAAHCSAEAAKAWPDLVADVPLERPRRER